MDTVLLIIISLSAFVATNMDDLFILMAFFTRPEFLRQEIIIGQYLGMIALISISSMAYLFQLIIPYYWISLLGIFPIIIGVKNLLNIKMKSNPQETPQKDDYQYKTGFKAIQVALVTFSNGGDNIGVYAPLLVGLSYLELIQVVLLFLLMTGLWCFLSLKMVDNKIIGDKIREYGHLILLVVLIAIGVFILVRGIF